MMRHWGSRPDYSRRYWDDEDETPKQEQQPEISLKGKLMPIAEESSQDLQSTTVQEDVEEEEEEVEEDENVDEAIRNQSSLKYHNEIQQVQSQDDNNDTAMDDHEQEGPLNDFHSMVPLHTAFGLQAEDLMLNSSMASPTGGKYRTVSVFGGVFAMPEDPVDSDNLSLSSASDGFSSDGEDYAPPKRSPKRQTQRRTVSQTTTTTPPPNKTPLETPRIVSPALTSSPQSAVAEEESEKDTAKATSCSPIATTPSSPLEESSTSAQIATFKESEVTTSDSSPVAPAAAASSEAESTSIPPLAEQKVTTSTTTDTSITRALEAFDQTESLLSKVLGELEQARLCNAQVMEDAITSLQVSKQTLESALCLEDTVMSC